MKSPFPGMDPYLEAHWGDVHASFVLYARDALQPHLPADLHARVEERVYVSGGSEDGRTLIPDVDVTESASWSGGNGGVAVLGDVAVAEPVVIELSGSPVTEGIVEIRTVRGERLVTSIEFLSPANKRPGPGQEEYLAKQDAVLEACAALVEIDLVRAGNYVLAAPKGRIAPKLLRQPLACMSFGWLRQRFELYPMPLRQRLPVLPIVLRPDDRRVPLDLQSLLDRAYECGRYETIDYSVRPAPRLSPKDAQWAEDIIASGVFSGR